MQTSQYGDEGSVATAGTGGTGGHASIDPMTGKVINAVSSVTGVSMDLERGLVYESTEKPNQVYYGGNELVPKLRDGLQFNGELFNAIDLTKKLDDEEAKRQKHIAKQMRLKEIQRQKQARELAKLTGGVVEEGSIDSATITSSDVPIGIGEQPNLNLNPNPIPLPLGVASAVAVSVSSINRPSSGSNPKVQSNSTSKHNSTGTEKKNKKTPKAEEGDFAFPQEGNEYTKEFIVPEPEETLIASEMAIAPSGKSLGSMGLMVNTEIKYHLGEELFKSRFASLPCDDIIIAWSFIANHDELQVRERDMAQLWLNVWDNNTRQYKMLKKKGFNMSTM